MVVVVVVVVVMVAVIVVYHCHYRHLSLGLVVWRVSTCIKVEIKMTGLTCVISIHPAAHPYAMLWSCPYDSM